jgi:hypothetical protein
MLTFLAALMCVFFDDTNLATMVSLGIVVGLLFITVVLLLYLEGEGTVAGDQSMYKRLFAAFADWMRSLVWCREEADESGRISKWGRRWRELNLRRKSSKASSQITVA